MSSDNEFDDNYSELSTFQVFPPYSQNRWCESDTIALKGEWSEIFSITPIKTNTIILILMNITTSFCFFNLGFMMKNVQGSLVQMTLASQSSELCAVLVSIILYTRLGPSNAFSISYLISFAGSLCLIIVMQYNYVELMPYFISLAKFGISATFNMIFIA